MQTFVEYRVDCMERSAVQKASHAQGQYVCSVACHNADDIAMIQSALLEVLCYAYGPGDGLSTGHHNAISVGNL